MAEERPPPPPPPNNEPRNVSRSAVARVLLSNSIVDPNDVRKEDSAQAHRNQTSHRLTESVQQNLRHDEVQPMESESGDGTPLVDEGNDNNLSPDVYITSPPLSSGFKALKCPMCDYSTNDKSNFRRHKRLHMRNNPATVLRCGKCDFSTVLPRKIREHYSQDHGEDYGPPVPQIPEALRLQAMGDNHFGSRHMELPHNQCTQASMPMAGTIHTLLGAPPSMQFARAEPQLLANCVTQYRPYEVPAQRIPQDNQMASDYLRSIVSNIITTHHTPRVPATSTITSSSFYLPTPVESSQGLSPLSHHLSSRQQPIEDLSGGEVKVKLEPVDVDGASDVSSSETPVRISVPRPMEAQTTQRLSIEVTPSTGDRNNEATPSGDQIVSTVNSSEAAESQIEVRTNNAQRPPRDTRESCSIIDSHQRRLTAEADGIRLSADSRNHRQMTVDSCDHPVVMANQDGSQLSIDTSDLRMDSCSLRPTINPRTLIDSRNVRHMLNTQDASSVDLQEPRPIHDPQNNRAADIMFSNVSVKSEMSNVGVQCALPVVKTEMIGNILRNTRTFLVERSVQCELLSSGRRIASSRVMSESDQSARPMSKCTHCGVTFEDEVLFSIHIGCHSHTDPFVCNVCGKQCYNKYGFYSHIMRGHQV